MPREVDRWLGLVLLVVILGAYMAVAGVFWL